MRNPHLHAQVRALLGPYLVFLCSTVNGYEGTGVCVLKAGSFPAAHVLP